jgi:hypothetical protein
MVVQSGVAFFGRKDFINISLHVPTLPEKSFCVGMILIGYISRVYFFYSLGIFYLSCIAVYGISRNVQTRLEKKLNHNLNAEDVSSCLLVISEEKVFN